MRPIKIIEKNQIYCTYLLRVNPNYKLWVYTLINCAAELDATEFIYQFWWNKTISP